MSANVGIRGILDMETRGPDTYAAFRLGARTRLGLEILGESGTLRKGQGHGGTGRVLEDLDPRAPPLPDFTELCYGDSGAPTHTA